MQVSKKVLKQIKILAKNVDCFERCSTGYETKLCALGKNKAGIITELIVLPRSGGCVFMPEVRSEYISDAFHTFIKKGGSFAGFAMIFCKEVAATTGVPSKHLWESRFEKFIWEQPDVPIMLVTAEQPPIFAVSDGTKVRACSELRSMPVEAVDV